MFETLLYIHIISNRTSMSLVSLVSPKKQMYPKYKTFITNKYVTLDNYTGKDNLMGHQGVAS